ncbi:MAG: flagellar basal body L-ring protein FlgH [Pseudohongiellaceae bacterium]
MPHNGKYAIAVLAILLLAGCASTPAPQVTRPQLTAIPDYPAVEPNGSIYQAQRGSMRLFEDRRPRQVGDVLTIVLEEQVNASKSSQSSASRSGNAELNLENLPAVLEMLEEYGFEVSGANDFSGAGASAANNSFTGTITVTVQQVRSNGNLVVEGEKQIAINQGTEYIRLSGVVNPRSISAGNSVSSTEVASARIEYLGDGYVNQAQEMGWMQRLFLGFSPF